MCILTCVYVCVHKCIFISLFTFRTIFSKTYILSLGVARHTTKPSKRHKSTKIWFRRWVREWRAKRSRLARPSAPTTTTTILSIASYIWTIHWSQDSTHIAAATATKSRRSFKFTDRNQLTTRLHYTRFEGADFLAFALPSSRRATESALSFLHDALFLCATAIYVLRVHIYVLRVHIYY